MVSLESFAQFLCPPLERRLFINRWHLIKGVTLVLPVCAFITLNYTICLLFVLRQCSLMHLTSFCCSFQSEPGTNVWRSWWPRDLSVHSWSSFNRQVSAAHLCFVRVCYFSSLFSYCLNSVHDVLYHLTASLSVFGYRWQRTTPWLSCPLCAVMMKHFVYISTTGNRQKVQEQSEKCK